MKINVTSDSIAMGDCKSPQRCMIAVAIRQFDPSITYVSVRTNGITITRRRKAGEGTRQHWSVPIKAARAIIQFDQEQTIKPFSFESKLIDEVRIPAVSAKQAKANKLHTQKTRAKMSAAGIPAKVYAPRLRVAGV